MAGILHIVAGALVAAAALLLGGMVLMRARSHMAPPAPEPAPPKREGDDTVSLSEAARAARSDSYAPPPPDDANIRRAAAFGIPAHVAQVLWQAILDHPLPAEAREGRMAELARDYRTLAATLDTAPPHPDQTEPYTHASEALAEGDLGGVYEHLGDAVRAALAGTEPGATERDNRQLAAAAAKVLMGDVKRLELRPTPTRPSPTPTRRRPWRRATWAGSTSTWGMPCARPWPGPSPARPSGTTASWRRPLRRC